MRRELFKHFFTLRRDFELEAPYTPSECAYKISKMRHTYVNFDNNETGHIIFSLWYVQIRPKYYMRVVIVPIDNQKCIIYGSITVDSRNPDRGDGCTKLFLGYIVVAGIVAFVIFLNPTALMMILLSFAIWAAIIITRNEILEILKAKTKAIEITTN